jgi:CDP-diacylglycerol--serine O-phosphatidyltransferase
MVSILSFADLISIINAIFGLLAIIMLFENFGLDLNIQIRVSFSLILLALLADGLDGIFARKFGKSEIGVILDSMADMTSFVIAPSVFIYFVYSNTTDFLLFYRHIYLIAALILFLSFGILRLASFHLMKKKEYFIGLPTPASTIILLNLAYLKLEFIYILPAVVIIGAAMVSNIKFPKPRVRMDLIATILIFLTLLFGKIYYAIFPLLLLFAMIIYSLIGPIFYKKFVE